jgi:hypothetical protein
MKRTVESQAERAARLAVAQEAVAEPDATDGNDDDSARVFSRPDGYHWLALDGKQEFGPFPTAEEALADMNASQDEESGGSVTGNLREAEQEIGIADWIDPETGEPAEGLSPPHLEEE